MFRQIVEKRPTMKKEFNKEARDLLKKLLNPIPYERLGNGPKGTDEIKLHPYFKDIDWEKLYNKELTPPYVPEVNDSEDTGQIDKLFTDERPEETPVDSALRDKDKAKNYYGGFTYKANHLGKSRDTMSTKA
jgi:serine/threonine protein kinase